MNWSLPVVKLSDKDLAPIRKLAKQGHSAAVIGRMLGIPRGTVITRCRVYGIQLLGTPGCGGKKGGAASGVSRKLKAKSKPKPKPKARARAKQKEQWVNPATMTKAERARREEEAKERAGEAARKAADALAAAAVGALRLPLVTVRRGPAVELPSWGKTEYQPRHYDVRGLNRGQCRFPLTEEAPHEFCAKPCPEDQAYCPDHHVLCHNGQTAKLPKWLVPKDAG